MKPKRVVKSWTLAADRIISVEDIVIAWLYTGPLRCARLSITEIICTWVRNSNYQTPEWYWIQRSDIASSGLVTVTRLNKESNSQSFCNKLHFLLDKINLSRWEMKIHNFYARARVCMYVLMLTKCFKRFTHRKRLCAWVMFNELQLHRTKKSLFFE